MTLVTLDPVALVNEFAMLVKASVAAQAPKPAPDPAEEITNILKSTSPLAIQSPALAKEWAKIFNSDMAAMLADPDQAAELAKVLNTDIELPITTPAGEFKPAPYVPYPAAGTKGDLPNMRTQIMTNCEVSFPMWYPEKCLKDKRGLITPDFYVILYTDLNELYRAVVAHWIANTIHMEYYIFSKAYDNPSDALVDLFHESAVAMGKCARGHVHPESKNPFVAPANSNVSNEAKNGVAVAGNDNSDKAKGSVTLAKTTASDKPKQSVAVPAGGCPPGMDPHEWAILWSNLPISDFKGFDKMAEEAAARAKAREDPSQS